MPPVAEPTMSALTSIVSGLYVGTNLAMLHFLWMLVNGSLLPHRGAVFPALQSTGIGEQAVCRAWKAFHSGMWQVSELIVAWNRYIQEQQQWRPRRYERYGAVAVDTTPFWWPKLEGLQSKYYHSIAEKALPAVILGLVAQIGEVAGKRVALPCSILRVDPKDPSEAALKKELLGQMSRTLNDVEIMLVDAGFKIKACHEADVPRFLLRLAKNFTARRNYLQDTTGKKGKPPTKGDPVRPLARKHKENLPFPQTYPLPAELRQKASVTDHLPKGILAHRRSKQAVAAVTT